MAAPASGLSKAEYVRQRYLDPGASKQGEEHASDAEKRCKKRRKRKKENGQGRMRIVDDDVSWKSISVEQNEEAEVEAEDGDQPVVAEFIDERPEEVKWMEEFRSSNKWKLLGDQNEESQGPGLSLVKPPSSSEATKQNKRKNLPDLSPPQRGYHSSLDLSPSRRGHQGSPDLPPRRLHSAAGQNSPRTACGVQKEHFLDKHVAHPRRQASPNLLLAKKKTRDSALDLSPPRKRPSSPSGLGRQSSARGSSPTHKKRQPSTALPRKCQRHDSESDSDYPPLRVGTKASSDSDLSPPRASMRGQHSPSDLSPPRRNRHGSSDSDLSPPRRGREQRKKACRSRSPPDLSPLRRTKNSKGRDPQMLSGGKTGLVSAELLRREQQELRRQAGGSKNLEDESRHAETVFRDKSGRKRDLEQERLEQRKRAEEKSERDEQYAKWGKGLVQGRQQQQNVEDAMKEMQKPLARYIDDQDLDKMLREQEREGDPMADFLRKKKAKERKDGKEKPRYNGPAPPLNRFNIWPGYRWDGVDRSNGFEQKRFSRIASKKAVQEVAYKWSVEDM